MLTFPVEKLSTHQNRIKESVVEPEFFRPKTVLTVYKHCTTSSLFPTHLTLCPW